MEEYDILYNNSNNGQKIDVNSFTTLSLLGKGTYGDVFLVKKKDTEEIFAMKIVKKKLVQIRNQQANIISERKILVKYINKD